MIDPIVQNATDNDAHSPQAMKDHTPRIARNCDAMQELCIPQNTNSKGETRRRIRLQNNSERAVKNLKERNVHGYELQCFKLCLNQC